MSIVFSWPLASIDRELKVLHEESNEKDHGFDGIQLGCHPRSDGELYAVRVFSPLPISSIEKYERIHGVQIVAGYSNVLSQINGAWIYRLALYGVPPSMTEEPPLLDRSIPQPLDIATANLNWRNAFSPSRDEFHFGSSSWTLEKNVGYFLGPSGRVRGLVDGQGCVGEWMDIDAFLREEIVRNREAYPEYLSFFDEMISRRKKRRK